MRMRIQGRYKNVAAAAQDQRTNSEPSDVVDRGAQMVGRGHLDDGVGGSA
jgi:hypothetical protein